MKRNGSDERFAFAGLQRRFALRAELADEGPNDRGVRAGGGEPAAAFVPGEAFGLGRIAVHAQIGFLRQTPAVQRVFLHAGDHVFAFGRLRDGEMRAGPFERVAFVVRREHEAQRAPP